MDSTALITTITSICIVGISIVLVVGALYLILIRLPRYQNQKVEKLKTSGRKGKAVILRFPEHLNKPHQNRKGLYTFVNIGLKIDVPGVDIYEVDKAFTFPTGFLTSLEVGKEVDVWIDPNNPKDLSKIVIHVK
jgi:hypothetical protein